MKLSMRLGRRSYDIILKSGSLSRLGQLANLNRKVLIVTDDGVPAHYAKTVAQQCAQPLIYTLSQGENSKSIQQYQTILQTMIERGFCRRDLVVAVGGGVVGDLAGFVAATYMRGVDFINCPTTTLSQIDSSIGGKVAINLGDAKNMVGAFWQPRLVAIDPDTLSTLPRRQFSSGLAEAVKMSLTSDPELFILLEQEEIEPNLETILYRSLSIKKQLVEQDEQEQGVRAVLNFGHTIGHGIEAVKGAHKLGEKGLYHGECVALGIMPMVESPALRKRVRAVYRKLGLPTTSRYDKQTVLDFMMLDKKRTGAKITVVKVPKLGQYRLDSIPLEELPTLLQGKK